MLREILAEEPTPVHNHNGHFYRLSNGIVVPSVTTILGGAYPKNQYYLRWLANQGGHDNASKVTTAAGNRGSRVHDAIFNLSVGQAEPEGDYDPEEQNAINAYKKWQDKYHPRTIWRERAVCSLQHLYAGRADCFTEIKGKPTLIDYKTSKGVWKSYRLQLLAYAQALREAGQHVFYLAVLRLDKRTGEFEYVPFKYSPKEFKVFLQCYELWKYACEVPIPQ